MRSVDGPGHTKHTNPLDLAVSVVVRGGRGVAPSADEAVIGSELAARLVGTVGHRFAVLGPPGIGKSTLAEALRQELRQEPTATVGVRLADWPEKQPFTGWLQERVRSEGVDPDTAVLVVDQLHQLEPHRVRSLVRGLTGQLRDHPAAGLVLCCRDDQESELGDLRDLLAVVDLAPGSDVAVDRFLAGLGESAAGLRTAAAVSLPQERRMLGTPGIARHIVAGPAAPAGSAGSASRAASGTTSDPLGEVVRRHVDDVLAGLGPDAIAADLAGLGAARTRRLPAAAALDLLAPGVRLAAVAGTSAVVTAVPVLLGFWLLGAAIGYGLAARQVLMAAVPLGLAVTAGVRWPFRSVHPRLGARPRTSRRRLAGLLLVSAPLLLLAAWTLRLTRRQSFEQALRTGLINGWPVLGRMSAVLFTLGALSLLAFLHVRLTVLRHGDLQGRATNLLVGRPRRAIAVPAAVSLVLLVPMFVLLCWFPIVVGRLVPRSWEPAAPCGALCAGDPLPVRLLTYLQETQARSFRASSYFTLPAPLWAVLFAVALAAFTAAATWALLSAWAWGTLLPEYLLRRNGTLSSPYHHTLRALRQAGVVRRDGDAFVFRWDVVHSHLLERGTQLRPIHAAPAAADLAAGTDPAARRDPAARTDPPGSSDVRGAGRPLAATALCTVAAVAGTAVIGLPKLRSEFETRPGTAGWSGGSLVAVATLPAQAVFAARPVTLPADASVPCAALPVGLGLPPGAQRQPSCAWIVELDLDGVGAVDRVVLWGTDTAQGATGYLAGEPPEAARIGSWDSRTRTDAGTFEPLVPLGRFRLGDVRSAREQLLLGYRNSPEGYVTQLLSLDARGGPALVQHRDNSLVTFGLTTTVRCVDNAGERLVEVVSERPAGDRPAGGSAANGGPGATDGPGLGLYGRSTAVYRVDDEAVAQLVAYRGELLRDGRPATVRPGDHSCGPGGAPGIPLRAGSGEAEDAVGGLLTAAAAGDTDSGFAHLGGAHTFAAGQDATSSSADNELSPDVWAVLTTTPGVDAAAWAGRPVVCEPATAGGGGGGAGVAGSTLICTVRAAGGPTLRVHVRQLPDANWVVVGARADPAGGAAGQS